MEVKGRIAVITGGASGIGRSFGVAGNNYATPSSRASVRVTWQAADVGGIPPEGGIEAAYKRQLAEAEDPKALRAEIEARIESARGPLGPLSRFQIEEMVDPRDTRRLICEWVETAYQIVREPPKTPAGEALREILRAAFPPPADGSKYRLKRGEGQEFVRILEAARQRLNASRNRRQAS